MRRVWWCCLLLCGIAAAQTGNFRIAGKVVSALDGRPLGKATVAIEGVPSRARVATTVTGLDGAFAFEHLAAGKYTLFGEVPGFLAANYDEHEGFSSAIVTDVAGLDVQHMMLRLKPAAAIAGRVLDEAGEPVRMAQVTLYRASYATGKRVVGTVVAAQTDDRGEYAMGSLAEGNYDVGVRATPWYAMHPETSASGEGPPVLTGVDPALDVAYPLTFYPDVPDWHDAVAVELKAGGEARVDVHLRPVRAVRLTIHRGPGEEQIGFPEMRLKVFDTYEPVGAQGVGNSGDSMDLVGLAPGEYRVQQHNGKTGAVTWTGAVDLRGGTADLSGGTAAGSLKVVVEPAGGGKLPAGLRVFLRGDAPGNAGAQELDDKGATVLGGVPAGDYRVAVFGEGRGYTVVRVEVKGKAATRDRVTLGSGESAEARVVVGPGQAVNVEGVAERAGKGIAGAMIVLVPVDDTDDTELFRRDQSDLDGTFVLPTVLPGRYIAVAIDDGWRLEWGKTAVLAKYLVKGVPVEVGSAAGQRTLKLAEPLVVQAR